MDRGEIGAPSGAVFHSQGDSRRSLALGLGVASVSLVSLATVAAFSGCGAGAEAEGLIRPVSTAIDDAIFAVNMRTGHGNRQHSVYLRPDGDLTARVSRFLSSGAFVPAQARVDLLRDSVVVASAHSDPQGALRIDGLQPGVYWVVADGEDGCTTFSVRVLAPDPGVAEERMWLHMTLVPRSVALRLLRDDSVAECEPPPSCPAKPAGAGGGGAGAAIAGSAGLVGLTGISGEASPAAP
jgi:hypothetical protein